MTTASTSAKGRKPDYRLYLVVGQGEEAIWNAIGGAWKNRDGRGFFLSVDNSPFQGRIVLRETTSPAQANGGQQ